MIHYSVKDKEELEKLQYVMQINFASEDSPHTIRSMLRDAGIYEDVEVSLVQNVIVVNASFPKGTGFSFNSFLPITGVHYNTGKITFYAQFPESYASPVNTIAFEMVEE